MVGKINEKIQYKKQKNNEIDIGVRVEVPNAIIDHLTESLYEPNWCTIQIPLKTRSGRFV